MTFVVRFSDEGILNIFQVTTQSQATVESNNGKRHFLEEIVTNKKIRLATKVPTNIWKARDGLAASALGVTCGGTIANRANKTQLSSQKIPRTPPPPNRLADNSLANLNCQFEAVKGNVDSALAGQKEVMATYDSQAKEVRKTTVELAVVKDELVRSSRLPRKNYELRRNELLLHRRVERGFKSIEPCIRSRLLLSFDDQRPTSKRSKMRPMSTSSEAPTSCRQLDGMTSEGMASESLELSDTLRTHEGSPVLNLPMYEATPTPEDSHIPSGTPLTLGVRILTDNLSPPVKRTDDRPALKPSTDGNSPPPA
ncbi:hypothetical protein NE237_021603 [Protea cynaroides]|uniref:Uncharacterized protein n=1 Tax=Protea cynaroides TaxID=273540 RepID=A0A9Q0H8U9_9MAGN|nr:hypothetical protein NE237_021603 [Protea cynaroides]